MRREQAAALTWGVGLVLAAIAVIFITMAGAFEAGVVVAAVLR